MYVAGHLGAFKPFKAIKKGVTSAAKGVATGAKATAKVAKTTAGKVAAVALAPAAVASVLLVDVAAAPIKAKLNTLKDRRAKKLAWERRRSKTPTQAEKNEARSWAKAELKKKGPHGQILALLAGAPPVQEQFGEASLGLAPAIAAAIPALIVLATQIVNAMAKSGQAPVDPYAVAAGAAAQYAPEAAQYLPRGQQQPQRSRLPDMAQDIQRRVPGAEVEYVPDDSAMEGVLPSGSVGAGVVFGALAVASGIGLYLTLK